ncbi:MAG: class I SAM-dependent methyltransferase [Bdellovibrionota bacterium]
MIRSLMRLRPVLPRPIYQALRDGYWRRFWAEQLSLQRSELGDAAAQSLEDSERAMLAEAIAECYPFASLLEVGCSVGQLFHIIAPQYPNVIMTGIDPDAERIAAGTSILEENGIRNVTLQPGSTGELSVVADGSFDVVVTSASLLYVPPNEIEDALRGLIRVARRSVVLLEQHAEASSGELTDAVGAPYWIHNFRELVSRCSPNHRATFEKIKNPLWITEDWQKTGHVIVISLR